MNGDNQGLIDDSVQLLVRHEGLRLKPYRDTVGKLTIGIGRNLDDVGISESEARLMLRNDLSQIHEELAHLSWFVALDAVRQMALIDMGFNLGLSRLRKFRKMIAAIESGDWLQAAAEMLDSRWARQVGSRADELAYMVQTGDVPQWVNRGETE